MPDAAAKQAMAKLLEGLSVLDVRELCVEGMRRVRRQSPQDGFYWFNALGHQLVPLLGQRKGIDVHTVLHSTGGVPEVLGDELAAQEPALANYREFLYWLFRTVARVSCAAGRRSITIDSGGPGSWDIHRSIRNGYPIM